MPRRPNAARLAKAQDKFKAAVTNYIVELGARPGRFYDHELDTPAGLLHLSVHDNWLATRFDDVARATAFTKTCRCPSNPYSGKWNFHFGSSSAEMLAPETVVPQLAYYFDALMRWDAAAV
jgi:hypothetical protein